MGHHLWGEIQRRSRQGELKPEVLKVWNLKRLRIASLILAATVAGIALAALAWHVG